MVFVIWRNQIGDILTHIIFGEFGGLVVELPTPNGEILGLNTAGVLGCVLKQDTLTHNCTS